MAHEIIPGLWIGGIDAVASHVCDRHITHVVTVLKGPLPEAVNQFLEKPPRTASPERHLYIDVDDVEDANLLQHFPKTNAFIRSVLLTRDMTLDHAQEKANSACLVHCAQGVSRSAAVIAAYLMETNNVDHEEAIEAVRRCRPSAAPNEGFVRQLALFSAMNCRLDVSFIPYKRFLAEQAALVVQKTGKIDRESLSEPADSFDHQRDDGFGADPPSLYRCRKCRSLVATSRNIIEVDSKSKQEAFSWRKRQKEMGLVAASVGEKEAPSGDIFVEPLKWMTTVLEGHLQGKLYCPRCSARLGTFNWSGIQNSAGAWVTPAFHLHISKLDEEKPPSYRQKNQSNPLIGIRKPRLSYVHEHARPPGLASTSNIAVLSEDFSTATTLQNGSQKHATDSQDHCFVTGELPMPRQHANSEASSLVRRGSRRFLIFDCDGVLVDSERLSCEALRLAIRETCGCDIPHMFPDDFRAVFGMDVRGCLEHYGLCRGHSCFGDDAMSSTTASSIAMSASTSTGAVVSSCCQPSPRKDERGLSGPQTNENGDAQQAAEDEVTKLVALIENAKTRFYNELTEEKGIHAFAGAKELMKAAQRHGIETAVASSGAPEKIDRNLRLSGLRDYFPIQERIVSASYVPRGKPAPDVYVEAMRRVGCRDPREAVVIEDAINGLRAAREAGCLCVGVATTFPTHMLRSHAHVVYERLQDIDVEQLFRFLEVRERSGTDSDALTTSLGATGKRLISSDT